MLFLLYQPKQTKTGGNLRARKLWGWNGVRNEQWWEVGLLWALMGFAFILRVMGDHWKVVSRETGLFAKRSLAALWAFQW